MAAGDLSPDQARYVQLVSQGTGLDARVVTAWVGAESGWSTNKNTHNYLNIGPGRSYANVDQAAQAAVSLVNNSGHYAGIRAAKTQGATAQLNAIGSSPWGTIKANLEKVYASVKDVRVNNGGSLTPVDFTLPDWVPGVGGETIPGVDDVWSSVEGTVGKVAQTVTQQLLLGAMTLVLGAAGIALTGLGVHKLASANKRDGGSGATGTLDKVGDVLSVAPVPQLKGAGAAAKTAGSVGKVAKAAKAVS